MIPKFEDLSTFVQLLSRSGTGQKITVYTNFITGPRGEGELDGAENSISSSWTTAARSC